MKYECNTYDFIYKCYNLINVIYVLFNIYLFTAVLVTKTRDFSISNKYYTTELHYSHQT